MKFLSVKWGLAWAGAVLCGLAQASVNCLVESDYAVRRADRAEEAYVKVSLTADKMPSKSRPSVNLAIVLDRSGSMSGEKIRQAREAACAAIERLDEKDVVSVVTYDDVAETIISAQHVREKDAIMARVRQIEPRGSTALFAGVTAGANELKKFIRFCEINRILLLSDGQANVGPSTPDELGRYGAVLSKEGVAVSTMGLGAYYNEDLMTRLAQKSDGNSYFVENSDDLPRIFSRELGDVFSVAATRVELKVKFGEGFTPIALIGRDGRILGQTVSLSLNQLYGGQEKYVIVKCDAAPRQDGYSGELATAEVSYLDAADNCAKTCSTVGRVSFSRNAETVQSSVNKDVVRARTLNENALRTEEAIRLADRGDMKGACYLMSCNSAAVAEAACVMGDEDGELSKSASMADSLNRSMSKGHISPEMRKKAVTKGFQTMNQQSDDSDY